MTTSCLRLLGPALLVALAACSPLPDLADRSDPALADADYPAFLTIDTLRAISQTDPAADRAVETGVETRATALQARAERLRRGTVVGTDDRRRLEEAIADD